MKSRVVLFDLDGTLIDSLGDLANSLNAVLMRAGFPGHPVSAYGMMIGDGMDMLVRRALPAAKREDEECAVRVKSEMEVEYGRRWAETTLPYSGIPELLDELTRRGVKLAVLSNKPDPFTQLIVSRLLPRWSFSEIVGAKPGVPRKPDPFSAIAIARRMNFSPEMFLYLGDSGVDMQTARSAGMFPLGALWGFRSADELRLNGARELIEEPRQLLKLIDDSFWDEI
ncbi:MAG: HAD family hydrolase [Candidatus Riflebacteria bacterium]|nr:HAD family hydrolase [Candidatus Riflebacteria bacterium]